TRRGMRRLDAGDRGPGRELGRAHLLPMRTAVGGQVDETVIRARPDRIVVDRRECDCRDRVELLLAGYIGADRTAGPLLLLPVIAREIGADDPPVNTLIERLEQDIRPDQQLLRVVGRKYLRMMHPAIAVIHLVSGRAELPFAPRVHLRGDLRSPVFAPFLAVVPTAVRHPGPSAGRHSPGHLAAAAPRSLGRYCGRGFHRATVLLRTVNMKWKLLVEIGVIELPGRLVVFGTPGFAAVQRNRRTAVIAFDQSFRIIGVDPEHMVVAVRRM